MASVLVVAELTGRRRRVTLTGGGLPCQGAAGGGDTAVVAGAGDIAGFAGNLARRLS